MAQRRTTIIRSRPAPPRPCFHPTPRPVMMITSIYRTRTKLLITESCHPTLSSLRRHTKMLRRSLGSPPAHRHPRQACLEPRFACQPLHSLAGWRWSCVRAGEYCSCTSGRRPRSSCVPPPPPLPNFPLVVSSQGKTMGKNRSRSAGWSASLSGWCLVCLCLFCIRPG